LDTSASAPKASVDFSSQLELDWYIVRVHAVGLALWQTFLSFDCTSRDIDISFILGLVMGWLCTTSPQAPARFACATCYAAVLVVLVLSEEHIFASVLPATDYLTLEGRVQLYFNVCILPFCTGAFWCFVAESPGRKVLLDARRSLITFMLISLTFPLYWTRIDLNMVQEFLGTLPHFSIFGILILSPVFKCVSIYVMLLSLQKKHTLDLVLALAAVLCGSSVAMYGVDNVQLVRLCVLAVLLTGHCVLAQCGFEIH
jgi:hypothetical protein